MDYGKDGMRGGKDERYLKYAISAWWVISRRKNLNDSMKPLLFHILVAWCFLCLGASEVYEATLCFL